MRTKHLMLSGLLAAGSLVFVSSCDPECPRTNRTGDIAGTIVDNAECFRWDAAIRDRHRTPDAKAPFKDRLPPGDPPPDITPR